MMTLYSVFMGLLVIIASICLENRMFIISRSIK